MQNLQELSEKDFEQISYWLDNKNVEELKNLIEIRELGKSGKNFLYLACESGVRGIVDIILAKGVDAKVYDCPIIGT